MTPRFVASHLGLFCLPMSNKKDAMLIWVMEVLGATWIFESQLHIEVCSASRLKRAYPVNTNFETREPRNLKFHTFGDLHTTKKC